MSYCCSKLNVLASTKKTHCAFNKFLVNNIFLISPKRFVTFLNNRKSEIVLLDNRIYLSYTYANPH